jgi:hypothetical protein
MTTQIKRRRGTTTQHASFTGAEAELTVDTDKSTVVVHDGSTAGGHPLAKASEVVAKSGDSMTGDLSFGDNDKAIFGAGSDLQIYHDGSNSYISELTPTGSLFIDGSNIFLRSSGGEEFIKAVANAQVELYYNDALKLATTSTGVDVVGTITSDALAVSNTSGATLDINSGLNAVDSKVLLHEGTTGAVGGGASLVYSGADNDFYIGVGTSVDTKRLSIDRATGDISFYEDTGTTPKFFWDASAERLGIGNSSPATALDVVGTITSDGLTVDGDASVAGTIGVTVDSGTIQTGKDSASSRSHLIMNNPNGVVAKWDTNGTDLLHYVTDEYKLYTAGNKAFEVDGNGDISFYEDTGTTPKMVWKASDERLGIGTSLPSAKLTVSDAGSSLFSPNAYIAGATADVMRLGFDSGGARTNIVSGRDSGTSGATNGYMAFETRQSGGGMTEAMRIDSSGNLLVGTTAQGGHGVVTGIEVQSASGTNLVCVNTNSTGTPVRFVTSSNTLAGTITTSGSTTAYNTSSDYRLKEDVQPMVGATDRVLALNPVNFAWKADGSRVDGFLAHEAQAVVPEAVTGEKDAVDDEGNPVYQGIDQSKLVPLLTAALQEALTEIAYLKARITALETN